VRGGEFVIERDRQPQTGACLGEAAAVQEGAPEHMVRSGITGIEVGGSAQGGDRAGQLAFNQQLRPPLAVPFGRHGLPARSGCASGGGTVRSAEQSGGEAGLHLAELLDGLPVPAGLCQGIEGAVGRRNVGDGAPPVGGHHLMPARAIKSRVASLHRPAWLAATW
jgi:hypothetical protein